MDNNLIQENENKIIESLTELRTLLTGKMLVNKLRTKGFKGISDQAALSRIINRENQIKIDDHNKYLNIIQEIRLECNDEYTKSIIGKSDLEIFYFSQIRCNLKKKINLEEPVRYFSKKYNLYNEDVTVYLSALPNIIFSYINEKFQEKTPCRMVRYSSDDDNLISNNNYKDFFNNNNYKNKISDIDFSVLGHALSPYSESLALLCELGRYKRICSIFRIKNQSILLTDVDWAKLNYSVTELQEDAGIKDLDSNLESCFLFRKQLYKHLGFNIDVKQSDQVKSKNDKGFNIIQKESVAFEEYSRLLEPILDEITAKIENRSLNLPSLIRSRSDSDVDIKERLTFLNLPIVDDMKNIYTISAVKKYFGRTDRNTFLYSLLQRYSFHDTQYDDMLKIGVESESKFDFAFAKMDAFEAGDVRKMTGLYFPHYYHKKGYTLIPYTFPSGLLKEKTQDQKGSERLKEATDKAILLFDYTNIERAKKVNDLIDSLDLVQLSKLMSDLLSFIYYYFKDKSHPFWIEGRSIFETTGFNDMFSSIYKFNDNQISQFQNHMFSLWFDAVEIPYFYYPYIISLKCIIDNNNPLEYNYRKFSYKLIMHTIKSVCESQEIVEWK